MTFWVGLTGGIGSGKSQVTAYFSSLGIPIINADKINHVLISTPNSVALQQIKSVFGSMALDDGGCLNRAYIRNLVFQDSFAKSQLESILHPLIMVEIRQQQAVEVNHVYGVVELPTLVENPQFLALVNRVLLVACAEDLRVQRVMERSHLSEQEVRSIMRSQASDDERFTVADDVIHNTGSLEDLEKAVRQQHLFYLNHYVDGD